MCPFHCKTSSLISSSMFIMYISNKIQNKSLKRVISMQTFQGKILVVSKICETLASFFLWYDTLVFVLYFRVSCPHLSFRESIASFPASLMETHCQTPLATKTPGHQGLVRAPLLCHESLNEEALSETEARTKVSYQVIWSYFTDTHNVLGGMMEHDGWESSMHSLGKTTSLHTSRK